MDEMNSAVQIELEGIKMVVKGGLGIAKWLIDVIRGIVNWSKGKMLEHPGEKKVQDILKLSNGEMPEIIDVPEGKTVPVLDKDGNPVLGKDGKPVMVSETLEEILKEAKAAGIPYAMFPDLNPYDGHAPVIVPKQYAGMFATIVSKHMEADLSLADKIAKRYSDRVAECKEALLTAEPDDKKVLNYQIDALNQANDELAYFTADDRSKLQSGKISVPLTEYLTAHMTDTIYDKNPVEAIEKGLLPKMPIKEALSPVREPSLMPPKGISFVVPDTGMIVTREFHKVDDEKAPDNGLVYSTYSLTSKNGEKYSFDDRNMTKAEFMAEVLPKICEKGGFTPETMASVVHDDKTLKATIVERQKQQGKTVTFPIDKGIEAGKDKWTVTFPDKSVAVIEPVPKVKGGEAVLTKDNKVTLNGKAIGRSEFARKYFKDFKPDKEELKDVAENIEKAEAQKTELVIPLSKELQKNVTINEEDNTLHLDLGDGRKIEIEGTVENFKDDNIKCSKDTKFTLDDGNGKSEVSYKEVVNAIRSVTGKGNSDTETQQKGR